MYWLLWHCVCVCVRFCLMCEHSNFPRNLNVQFVVLLRIWVKKWAFTYDFYLNVCFALNCFSLFTASGSVSSASGIYGNRFEECKHLNIDVGNSSRFNRKWIIFLGNDWNFIGCRFLGIFILFIWFYYSTPPSLLHHNFTGMKINKSIFLW